MSKYQITKNQIVAPLLIYKKNLCCIKKNHVKRDEKSDIFRFSSVLGVYDFLFATVDGRFSIEERVTKINCVPIFYEVGLRFRFNIWTCVTAYHRRVVLQRTLEFVQLFFHQGLSQPAMLFFFQMFSSIIKKKKVSLLWLKNNSSSN